MLTKFNRYKLTVREYFFRDTKVLVTLSLAGPRSFVKKFFDDVFQLVASLKIVHKIRK